MWRYYYTIIRNIFRIPEAVKTMNDMIKLSKSRSDEFNEEYKDMNTQQIAELVKERIENKIAEVNGTMYEKNEE